MRTMLILHFISSLHRGGAEMMLLQLVRELNKRGWKQQVLYIHKGPILEELHKLDIMCMHITAPGRYLNPLMWHRLRQALKRERPSVLMTSLWAANLMGQLIGWMLGIPVISVLHTVAAHEGTVRTYIDKLVPIAAQVTIAASQTIADSMNTADTRQARTMTTIPNGIDIIQFHAARLVKNHVTYHRTEHDYIIGTVGRLVPVKNFDLLILVFSRISQRFPHARLLIVGTGPEEHKLRALIGNQPCDERITLISGQSAAPYYDFFNCFVQPSSHEGLSIALLEALATQLPVIVTGIDSGHEVITHRQTGVVIPPNDQAALEHALSEFLHNPDHARTYGMAGYETTMKKYTAERMVDAYEKILRETVT